MTRTETVDALLDTRRGYVVAAAGCGKTEAIARAVERSDGGRQLVLTHTHAGVKALRDRLVRFGVSEQRFRVHTIAGWCLRYAASFPHRSCLIDETPTAKDWALVYPAARSILNTEAVQQVIVSSYAGVFIDEYQDCTKTQHAVVLELAQLLPCRILGDPLQGIFGFNEDPLIDWKSDIEGTFEELPALATPHRWRNNPQLGAKLVAVRNAILSGQSIDLRRAPFVWRQLPSDAEEGLAAQVAACEMLHQASGSVVAIRRWPHDCYTVAGRLRGRYTCMEEMDCKDLLNCAASIEGVTGVRRCAAVFDFIDRCMTGIAAPLSTIRKAVSNGQLPQPHRLLKHRDVAEAVVEVATAATVAPVTKLLKLVDEVPDRRIFRRELWREMTRALYVYASGRGGSLRDAAWELRHRLRRQGRSIEKRTISRTLLIKGLEFEHALILDASEHDAKNFYVAATRPTKSLTICSRNPVISF
jgi:AAA domain